MRNQDTKKLAEAYNNMHRDQYDILFDWLGGQGDILGGGLYPGVRGVEAVKNMILDAQIDEASDLKPYIAAAIDTLTKKQLLELILLNYNGEPVSSLPSSVQEFDVGGGEYFEASDTVNAQEYLDRAVKYFAAEPNIKIPAWAQKRDDFADLRSEIVGMSRKRPS